MPRGGVLLMAQFVGLGNVFSKLIITAINYAYKLFFFVFVNVSKGLGKFIEISFEYFVKLLYQMFKFIRR
jgi:hypothetical protein